MPHHDYFSDMHGGLRRRLMCSRAATRISDHLLMAGAIVLLGGNARTAHAQTCPPDWNPIRCENEKIGDPPSAWQIDATAGGEIDDVDESLEGFADRMSYVPGETAVFKVSTNEASYTIDIYRLGYYGVGAPGGRGARLWAPLGSFAGGNQQNCNVINDPPPAPPKVNLVDCGNWTQSASWVIPLNAVSGVYVAKLTRTSNPNLANHIYFVVRDPTGTAPLVFQTSDTTWQAYNWWGDRNLEVNGVRPRYSLYHGPLGVDDPEEIENRARKVSYNRPFASALVHADEIRGNNVFLVEHSMIRWLEQNNFHVSYISGSDTDRPEIALGGHQVFLSVGHDEYWSQGQRDKVEAERDAGRLHLAFFSGNEVYWKTRWESNYRTLVTYKEPFSDPPFPDPTPTWTGLWRDVVHGSVVPENRLTGTSWMAISNIAFGDNPVERVRVFGAEGRLRFWRNTTLATKPLTEHATLQTPLGYEWDEDWTNGRRPPGLIHLSTATFLLTSGYIGDTLSQVGLVQVPGVATHHLTLYRAASGALVFGAGSFGIIMGLDKENEHTRNICSLGSVPPCGCSPAGDCTDLSLQQGIVNLFADMGVQPQLPLKPGLSLASASMDSAGPSVTVTSDTSAVLTGTTLTIEGSAQDSGGGRVAAVEVSTDQGQSWNHAVPSIGETTFTWRFNWTAGGMGLKPVNVRAIDDSGNIGSTVTRNVNVMQNFQNTMLVHAAGTPQGPLDGGRFPKMKVFFNSQEMREFLGVQGNVGKKEFEFLGLSSPNPIPPLKNIRVSFTDTSPVNGEDRNVYLQKVTINGVDHWPLLDTVAFFQAGMFNLKFLNFWGAHDLSVHFGVPGDIPISGNWTTSDDYDSVGIFRNGIFHLANDSGVLDQTIAFGLPGDVPVTGDWNGDGVDDVGVFRSGVFHLRNPPSVQPPVIVLAFGLPTDIPLAGDWDGNGIDTVGVYRNGSFFLAAGNSNPNPVTSFQFTPSAGGQPVGSPLPVVGDWDWNGADSVGVFQWNAAKDVPTVFLRSSNDGGPADQTFRAGASGDRILAGHWRRQ